MRKFVRSELINNTHVMNVGQVFKITNLQGTENDVIFTERKLAGKYVEIVTTNNGFQPNAFITVDCDKEVDQLDDKTITAFVIIKEGYHIILINHENTVILKIIQIDKENFEITVKCLFKFDTYNNVSKYTKFEYALNYAMNRMYTPKTTRGEYFAINRNRRYELRLMVPDEEGRYYGFSNSGKKLILNKKSYVQKYSDGKPHIMRIYYYTKHQENDTIIVDGFILRPAMYENVFRNSDEFEKAFGADAENIYQMNIAGEDFITIVSPVKGRTENDIFNNKPENNYNIKIVYESWKNFSVLLLNDHETRNFEFDDSKIEKIPFAEAAYY